MKKLYLVVCVIVLLCFVSGPASAQTSYGAIAGTVTDSTGATVAGAKVTAVSDETHETHVTTTTGKGGFSIEAVGTGLYTITVEAPRFAEAKIEKVGVDPSRTTSVNASLKIGQVQDVVEISANSELLQTESGEISATIGSKEISDLPISSLNPYALATTLPGVTTVTTGINGNGTRFSVNGSRSRANNFLIEGQDDNDAGITGQGLQPQNQEATDSVTFLLNSYSAEFGHTAGGIANLVYKSGTNSFHGAVWDRILNSSLNATDHGTTFSGGVKTKFRENIYGYRFGGPVFKNKLFFFVSQQFDHYRATANLSILTVPTAAGYSTLSQFTNNAKVKNLVTAYGGLIGNSDPTKFTAYAKSIPLGPDPVTGVDRGSVAFGGVQRSVGQLTNSNEFVAKSDYLISGKDKLQLRFVRSPYAAPYDLGNFPGQLPLFDTQQRGTAYNAGFVENHIFSPRILNELRGSYGRIGFIFDLRPDTYSNPLAVSPGVSISNITGYGIPTNVPQGRFHNTYQLQDALSYVRGNHTFKIGLDEYQIRVRDNVPFVFYGTSNYTNETTTTGFAYSALANYVDDYSGYTTSTGQAVQQQFGSNTTHPTLASQNYYAQDHWKVRSDLTLDLGVRYEYTGAPFNHIAFPAIDLSNPGCFQCRVTQVPNYKNFAPRLGFAYSPTLDKKTVIRGGIGISYDHLFTNVDDNIVASAPNAASPVIYGNQSVSQRGTPNFSQQFANLNKNPLPLNSETTVNNHFLNPETIQYNLAIEQELPGAMLFTLGYAGTRGEHLFGLEFLNPTIAGGARLIPTRGAIGVHDNSGDSKYNALEASLDKRYAHGFLGRISYTWAKNIDDVSDDYTAGNYSAYPQIQLPFSGSRKFDYGPSAFDHRQRAVLTTVYDIPKWHAEGYNRIAAAVVNGFSVSGIVSYQSGSVINVQTGYDINGDGITNDRPQLVNPMAPLATFAVLGTDFYSAAKGGTAGVYCDGSYLFLANKAADQFCHPVVLSNEHFFLGNRNVQNATISRNASYTPGIFGADLTATRTFKVWESHQFLFRAEAINVLNHANTGIPNFTLATGVYPTAPGYSTTTFGNYAFSTSGARNLRFFVKYEF